VQGGPRAGTPAHPVITTSRRVGWHSCPNGRRKRGGYVPDSRIGCMGAPGRRWRASLSGRRSVDVIPTFAGRVWHQISTLAVNVNVVRGSPQERGRARPVGRLPGPESSHQVDIVALPGQAVSMGRFPRHRLPARPNARDNGVSHAPGLPPAAGSRSDFRCSSLQPTCPAFWRRLMQTIRA
jgi:hypothetical protein